MMSRNNNVVGRRGFDRKWLFILLVLLIVAALIMYAVQVITAPNWSFKVVTDKTVYKLGENITITAVLKNNGYITHSFKAYYEDPIEVTIGKGTFPFGVWYSSNQKNIHDVSIPPGQTIERTVVWNQTDRDGKLVEPGIYTIRAEILDGEKWLPIFEAEISITITE